VKIEKEIIQLKPYDLLPASQGGQLTLRHSGRQFQVNANQYSMLEALRSNSMSLESLVQFYLGQGWLVSFRELHALVHFLIQENAFVDPSFAAYFLHHENAPLLAAKKTVPVSRELPFLRSLDPNLADHFIKNSQVLKLKAQTRIVAQQERSRDLYIVLAGQLGIYKSQAPNQRERTAILGAGALFGERGFLLGQARSADVIALTDCEVLKIPFLSEYDQLIRTDKAQSLQHRFWVLQALASSDFFSSLPSDSHDALIFSGRLVQSPAYQVLFREGQAGNACYIIVQGSAVVSKNGQNINILNQGACFGEISLLMSGGVRTATVTTQTDSILLEINQNHFYTVLAQNLVLAKKIEELALQRLSKDASR
jgi:CRP-like cAMP-binding protein